jgi:hypothetical protein
MRKHAVLAFILPVILGGAARYTASGDMVFPADYREWVFLGSGLDMSYTKGAPMADASMFDNVFVDPASWQAFKQTGHWPEGTMLVMEARGAGSKGSINRNGHYQTTELMGAEVHVRDTRRFPGGWAFFVADTPTSAKLVPQDRSCYTCHLSHGAVDTTFVQFYPIAKPIAEKAGTYHEP